MARYPMVWFFVFFLCVFSVIAPSTVVNQNSPSSGLVMAYPKIDYYKLGNNITLNFHVFNSSGYYVTKNDCYFHLYDNLGNHILKKKMYRDSLDSFDYEVDINKTVLRTTQRYGFISFCNGTQGSGFDSGSFFVTHSGLDVSSSGFSVSVILPLVFGLFLLVGGFLIGPEHVLIRPFLWILSLLSVFVSTYLAIDLFNEELLTSGLSNGLSWFVWVAGVVVALLIFYLCLFLFSTIMSVRKQKRERELEY